MVVEVVGEGEGGRGRKEDVAPLRAVDGAEAEGAVSAILCGNPALLIVEGSHCCGRRGC